MAKNLVLTYFLIYKDTFWIVKSYIIEDEFIYLANRLFLH